MTGRAYPCPLTSSTLSCLPGLKRLHGDDLHLPAHEALPVELMLPAACQGAIGVMCQTGDALVTR